MEVHAESIDLDCVGAVVHDIEESEISRPVGSPLGLTMAFQHSGEIVYVTWACQCRACS